LRTIRPSHKAKAKDAKADQSDSGELYRGQGDP
jgi:hypothetical protein